MGEEGNFPSDKIFKNLRCVMDSSELTQAALRVLNDIAVDRRVPDPADVATLKQNASPSDVQAPIDDLAREIVERELGKRSLSAQA
jgi:hypothetical protein